MSALGQKRSFDPDQPNVRLAPIADVSLNQREIWLRNAIALAEMSVAGASGWFTEILL